MHTDFMELSNMGTLTAIKSAKYQFYKNITNSKTSNRVHHLGCILHLLLPSYIHCNLLNI